MLDVDLGIEEILPFNVVTKIKQIIKDLYLIDSAISNEDNYAYPEMNIQLKTDKQINFRP